MVGIADTDNVSIVRIRLIRRPRPLKLAVWTKWTVIVVDLLPPLLLLRPLHWWPISFGTAVVLIEPDFLHILHSFYERGHRRQGAGATDALAEARIKASPYPGEPGRHLGHVGVLCVADDV